MRAARGPAPLDAGGVREQPVKHAPLPMVDERLPEQPWTRRGCADVPRPCPFISCEAHLAWYVRHKSDLPGGGPRLIRASMTDDEIVEALLGLRESCALDVAARGGVELEEVADILGLSKQRVQQLEIRGLLKLRAGLAAAGIRQEDDGE